ncbi:C40 family peptidase [Chitinophagaceae bacterium 26-R-25]|nr:C40 family peptidase [Chitinophagaceae bacterium 26-R-25]
MAVFTAFPLIFAQTNLLNIFKIYPLKNWFVIIVASFGIVSCSTSKHATATGKTTTGNNSSSPEFINSISVVPGSNTKTGTVKADNYTKYSTDGVALNNLGSVNIEKVDQVLFKYAIMLDIPVEYIGNQAKMFDFIEDWYGTPYKYGGNDRKGIDCSGFSSTLMSNVFAITVPRTSRDQYQNCQKVSKSDLKEGDLVFFNIRGRGVSHVGVYLTNNKFVHASVNAGVVISDLGEGYYSTKFMGGGRPKK